MSNLIWIVEWTAAVALIFLAIGLIQIAFWVAIVEFFTWVAKRKPVHFGRGWSDL